MDELFYIILRLFLTGDVGGECYDLVHLSITVQNRVVGALNPNFLTSLANSAIDSGIELTSAELGPESLIVGRRRIDRIGKHSMVMAFDLVRR